MHQELRDQIERIVKLSDQEFAFVLTQFKTLQCAKGDYLIRKGEPVENVYFVISGLLKLIYTDLDSNQEHIISFAMEDWWETDFPAFFAQSTSLLSLQALEPTTLLCLSHGSYLSLLEHLPKMTRFFLEKSTLGFATSQQRIITLLTANAKERYEQLQAKHPDLLQRVSKTQLAAYLGVSRETLSRLYKPNL